MGGQKTDAALDSTREMLGCVEMGLAALKSGDPAQRIPGLYNVVVFGRAVTNMLQRLKNIEPGFEDWYARYEREMRKDKLMKFFYKLRTEILKEGKPQTSATIKIEYLDSSDMASLMQNPPPGAKDFFMGDSVGGTGWEVELPDGTTTKYYVALPEDIKVEMGWEFPDPPKHHKRQRLQDTSVEALADHYVAYLRHMVTDAQSHFG